MSTCYRLFVGFVLSGLAVSLSAQTRPASRDSRTASPSGGPGAGRGSRGLPIVAQQILSQGDKDGDSELGKTELTDLADRWFDKLDPDKSGRVTEAQVTARLLELFPTTASGTTATGSARSGRGTEAGSSGITPEVLGPILFASTDLDKDGSLTKPEFNQAFAKWFDDWDSRKSGKINEDNVRKGLEIALPRSGAASRFASTSARPRADAPIDTPKPEANRRDLTNSPAPGTTNAPTSLDKNPANVARGPARETYSAFGIIAERNIFDTNRRARRRDGGDESKPKRVDTITLVGTLVTESGIHAFFDGSGSEFRKAVQRGQEISNVKVTDISPNSVTVQLGTNLVNLRVGMQLRREELGDWQVVEGSGPPTAASTSASSTNSEGTSADDDSDIVKRLMRQREQEMK